MYLRIFTNRKKKVIWDNNLQELKTIIYKPSLVYNKTQTKISTEYIPFSVKYNQKKTENKTTTRTHTYIIWFRTIF